jgi:hypothetical protein
MHWSFNPVARHRALLNVSTVQARSFEIAFGGGHSQGATAAKKLGERREISETEHMR